MHIEEAGNYRIELSSTATAPADYRVYYKYRYGIFPEVLDSASSETGNPVTTVFDSVKLPVGDIELTLECAPKSKGNVFMYYFAIVKN